jgi:hypothetical protein
MDIRSDMAGNLRAQMRVGVPLSVEMRCSLVAEIETSDRFTSACAVSGFEGRRRR